MAYEPWTDEHKAWALMCREGGMAYREIAESLNLRFNTQRTENKVSDAFRKGMIHQEGLPDEVLSNQATEQSSDGSTTVKSNRPYSDEEMAEMFGIDTSIWSVSKRITNIWGTNFQTKVWWDAEEREVIASQWDEMLKALEGYSPASHQYSRPSNAVDELLYEVCLFDAHIGALMWGPETGTDFDTQIGLRDLKDTAFGLMQRAPGGRVVLPIGQDLFHFDTLIQGKGGATAAGTPQDVDSRWQKLFVAVWQAVVQIIEDMVEMGNSVDVVIVPGNHDTQTSFYLGELLSALYAGSEVVRVDNDPRPRKYYRFGNVLLGYTHGKDEKLTDLPAIMATEARKDWGECLYREWHIGHTHGEKVIEDKGVVVRTVMAITATESWHNQKGYIANRRGGQAFEWHREWGLLSTHYEVIVADKHDRGPKWKEE